MADRGTMLTYEEAVAEGKIYVWTGSGDKLAKSERFDLNTKFVMDNMNALDKSVDATMQANKAQQEQLNAQVEAHLEDLDKIKQDAPEAMDTLLELGRALGNDNNFAATVANDMSKRYTKEEIAEILLEFHRKDQDVVIPLGKKLTTGSTEPLDIDTAIRVNGKVEAASFNGHTIETSVPDNAVFTDTQLTKAQILDMSFATTANVNSVANALDAAKNDLSTRIQNETTERNDKIRYTDTQLRNLIQSEVDALTVKYDKKVNDLDAKYTEQVNILNNKIDTLLDRVDRGNI